MVNISCLYATARPVYPEPSMIGRTDDHLTLFLDSLEQQTFTDFEAVIADCYYKYREHYVVNNTYKGKKYGFNIRHFEVKSPWQKYGLWHIQATWNQALMVAQGEHICFFGDCCEIPSDYLEKIWGWYLKGYWCMGLVVYKTNGKLEYQEKTEKIHIGSLPHLGITKPVMRDVRWPYVLEHSEHKFIKKYSVDTVILSGYSGGQQFQGYSSAPLNVLLRVNGFDENFDGEKSLTDTEIGIRMFYAGYSNVFLLDKNVYIYENGLIIVCLNLYSLL